MAEHSIDFKRPNQPSTDPEEKSESRMRDFPWWFVALVLIAIFAGYTIFSNTDYREAFDFVKIGLRVTIQTSLISYVIALLLGLLAGLGRISRNVFIHNAARLYVELIRGIPMLVLI
ncbi:MAG: ABC transporter permease subunit, partial [Anaerolineales bacterium]|nr:ABC transporter permease subunit [Anaerolineales bacterium]